QKLLCPPQPVFPVARSDQNRAFFPEWTGNRSEPIDPHRSLTLGDGRVTRCSQYSGRSTLRHPDRQPSARQSASGKDRIERIDSRGDRFRRPMRSEEHTSELQSPCNLVCRLLLEKKKKNKNNINPSLRSPLHKSVYLHLPRL